MEKVIIRVFKNDEGFYSLQLMDMKGNGEKVIGSKVYKPYYDKTNLCFKVDVEELMNAIKRNKYKVAV